MCMFTLKVLSNESYIITDPMSDHFPCLVSYAMFQTKPKLVPAIIEKCNITEEEVFKIQHKLLHFDWSPLYSDVMEVNDSYKYLSDAIQTALDEYAPLKKVKINPDERFHEPWLSVTIKRCNQKSRKLCNRAKMSGLKADQQKYVVYRNVLNRIKQYEKRKFYADLFKKIGKSTKLLWEVVNNLVRKTNSKQGITEVLQNNKIIIKQTEIAQAFNNYFASASRKVYDSIPNSNMGYLLKT